ncbi:MAG: hypothetical protein HY699_12785 [Deltaproteobacteria bacterium]|nr:hypothetical protein [Deltaproteobacteria bacterium]
MTHLVTAAGAESASARHTSRGIAVRLFLTCWLVFALHFATNTVREIYPALTLGDHFSLDVSEYLDFHPDIFAVPGRGAFINNNPGVSMLGAIPYLLTRPLIDRLVQRQLRVRAASGAAPAHYDTIYPMAREFHRKAQERGLELKFGLAAAVMQALCMAPLSALSVVVMFHILTSLNVAARAAAALALLYAVATPVLYRTAQLNQNVVVGHFALFAFALLWRPWDDPRAPRQPRYWLAGLLSGAALLCDYSGLIVLLALGFYALARRRALPLALRSRADIPFFAAGASIGIAVLLASQWLCFGHPLYPAQHYMPPAHFSDLGYHGMAWPQLDLAWATAFDMRFGLFTSAPLLLLALYPPAWRHGGGLGLRERACIAGLCVLFFLFCSANQYGRMQFNCGVRHIVPVVPFLFLIAAGALRGLPTAVAAGIAIVTAYWSWCLAMYRDVEQGLGVFESLIHVTSEGLRLPWLTTAEHMGYLPPGLLATPLLLLSGALVWGLWRVKRLPLRPRRRFGARPLASARREPARF